MTMILDVSILTFNRSKSSNCKFSCFDEDMSIYHVSDVNTDNAMDTVIDNSDNNVDASNLREFAWHTYVILV